MKKHPTLKSINRELPRFDWLRRNYMFHGELGMAHGMGYLMSAFANLDENGDVDSITLYTVGDAMERRHYYRMDGVVDITESIEMALWGRYGEFWQYTGKQFRHLVALSIKREILNW